MYMSNSDRAILLLKLYNEAQQNISSEDIKAKVREIYMNKNFSDEEKIRKIQAKIDKAERRGFWKGIIPGFVAGAGVAAALLKKFKE